MLATVVPLSLVLLAADLPDAHTGPAEGEPIVAGLRQRPSVATPKRGIHELKDPAGWPAEPAAPAGALDEARFDRAVIGLCAEVAPSDGLPELARLVREVSAQTKADPFLMAA